VEKRHRISGTISDFRGLIAEIRVLVRESVRSVLFACLTLLSAIPATAAAPPALLGVDFSEWVQTPVSQMAADGSGSPYLLTSSVIQNLPGAVIKLTPDGNNIAWQRPLDAVMSAMAVDRDGNVFVAPALVNIGQPSLGVFAEKIASGGSAVVWKTPLRFNLPVQSGTSVFLSIATDGDGRVYVSGHDDATGGYLVRLKADGTPDYSLSLTGIPVSLSVTSTGVAYLGMVNSLAYGELSSASLARIGSNGSPAYHIDLPQFGMLAAFPPAVAADPQGNALVFGVDTKGNAILMRYDSGGSLLSSRAVPGGGLKNPSVVIDANGNAYTMGDTADQWYPVKNSIATCELAVLNVFAPDGSLLQTTYIPGAQSVAYTPFAAAPDGVFLIARADTTFTPTETGPFPGAAGPYGFFLMHLSPHDNVPTFPLACIANSASAMVQPVAPGAMVTLIGNGLGPEDGVQTQATMSVPFPVEAGNVKVTFDDLPAPLLWVQDRQVNAIVPWGLTPGTNTNVCVTWANTNTNCLSWPVAQTMAGVFLVDGGFAAALNEDGTVNSAANPAPASSIVSIFVTGLGPISPGQPDGSLVGLPLPSNTLPVTVSMVHCDESPFPPHDCTNKGAGPISYAGPAPFLAAGVSQINFQVLDQEMLQVVVTQPDGSGSAASFYVHVSGQ